MNKALRKALIKQSELDHERRLKFGVVGGLKKGESVIDYFTDEQIKEIDYISGVYDPRLTIDILDKADDIIKSRVEQKPIKYPYKYIEKIIEKYFDF